MSENKIETSVETQKVLNPEQQIDFLLRSRDPVSDLGRMCLEIPRFLHTQELTLLREKGQEVEIIYRCLPTLQKAIDHFRYFGLDTKELFETGFFSMQSFVAHSMIEKEPREDFKTYLSGEIRRSIEDFVAESYGLGGVHNFPVVELYRRCWLDFIRESKREPTLHEMENICRMCNERSLKLKTEEDGGFKISKIRLIYEATVSPVRFWAERDNSLRPVEKEALRGIGLNEDLYQKMRTLTPRERTVLRLRFFVPEMDGDESTDISTFKMIAEYFGVKEEQVRSIEASALRKLRHPYVSKPLRDYIRDLDN